MNREYAVQLRETTTSLYRRGRQWAARVPLRARIILGLFLFSAVLMAIYTSLTAGDASLHLRLQHDFRSAQVSVWVDGDLAYSGRVTGSTRKRFGLIPTDSAQGNLSQIIAVRSGSHNIRLRIEPDNGAMQEESTHANFSPHTERDLVVSARHNGLTASWQGMGRAPVATSSSVGWLSEYAGSLFLTVAGSIVSALAGYAIKELPARRRSPSGSAPNAQLGGD